MPQHPYYPKPVPDIDDVVYPTTAPPRFPLQLTGRTILADRPHARTIYPIHLHEAAVDAQGNGATTTVASHYHRVRNGEILPDESDGHVHRLTGLPSGAGAPVRNYPPAPPAVPVPPLMGPPVRRGVPRRMFWRGGR